MAEKDETYLINCLAEPDSRIRKAAQFELVRRRKKGLQALLSVARKNKSQLARLHAIWGIAKWRGVGRREEQGHAKVAPLIELLKDKDLEVRTQAAKVLVNPLTLKPLNSLSLLKDYPSRPLSYRCGLGKTQVGQSHQPSA